MNSKNFFNLVSVFYDGMINPESYLNMRTKQLKGFVKNNMKNAVDLGCGTGIDSVALGKNGLYVTGFDIAPNMIEQSAIKALDNCIESEFYPYAIDKIPKSFNDRFDIAISLGNSISNVPNNLLKKSFKRVYDILKPKGKFLFQILNYKQIYMEQKRILSITEDKYFIYTRFYDFEKDTVNFNILKAEKRNLKNNELITTKLYVYNDIYLKSMLEKIGFKKTKVFGNLLKEKYFPLKSKDLVILTEK